jgi:hypothetical protein
MRQNSNRNLPEESKVVIDLDADNAHVHQIESKPVAKRMASIGDA